MNNFDILIFGAGSLSHELSLALSVQKDLDLQVAIFSRDKTEAERLVLLSNSRAKSNDPQ